MNRRTLLTACFALSLAVIGETSPALAASPGEKKKGGGPGFTQFPMLSVFTQSGGYKHGTLSLDMGLYATDPKMVDRIKLYMPRLKDAYIQALQGYATNLNASSLVDADYVDTQLQAATDRVLGKTGAKVLVGSILLN